MDLTMLIGNFWKREIKNRAVVLCLLFAALITFSCTDQEKCIAEESQICDSSSRSSGPNKLNLSEAFNFEWDELYIVTGPRFPDDVSQMIGQDYERTIPDDTRQYIFVDNGTIVRDEQSRCHCLDYFKETSKTGFVKYTRDSSVSILCKSIEGEVICTVQD